MTKGQLMLSLVAVACVLAMGILYLNERTQSYQYRTGDLNKDGVVDALDASILFANWSQPVNIDQATASGGLKVTK